MLNKVFTSFDVAAEVRDLRKAIPDSRVNNIYQMDPKTLLFKLHKANQQPLFLLLEAGRRFHLTAYAPEKPMMPPAFCMSLRKHLRNSWLRTVKQHEFERISMFTFETKEGALSLILELFGDGNMVLTSETSEILQALVFKRMRDRNIVRGESYAFPPPSGRNPLTVKMEELENDLKNCGDFEIVRTVAKRLGLGGVYAEETLLRAGIEKTKHCEDVSNSEIKSIHESLSGLLSSVADKELEPRIVLAEDGNFFDVVPFQLWRYEAFKFQPFNSFNEALDEFYLRVTASEKATGGEVEVGELNRQADRLRRVVTEQEQALREAETKVDQEKAVGDLIYACSAKIQELLDRSVVARAEGRDLKSALSEIPDSESRGVSPKVAVEGIDTQNQTIHLRVGAFCFDISIRKSIFENAAQFYERGKKAKLKATGISVALVESRRKLSELKQKIRSAETLQLTRPAEFVDKMVKRKIQVKQWYEKFRWFISSDGYLVVAGKDAVSNEVLVKKHTGKDDAVFHADVQGAPFVVVKAEGKNLGQQALGEAAEYAAAFSRAWREGFGSVDVYWVRPDQLSKSGPSGEYVTHGAFAVIGKRNWMRGVPLRTAIGVLIDDEVRFLGGPLDAVKAKTKVHVTLGPGDFVGKEFLKQVLRALAVQLPKEQCVKVGRSSVELIRELVPYTKGRILESPSKG